MIAAPAPARLPSDLEDAMHALALRCDVCHLVSLQDLRDALPARRLDRAEIEALVRRMADDGLCLVDGEAADLLADGGGPPT